MGLFTPAYYTNNSKKIDKGIAALSKIGSDAELVEIYRNANFEEISLAALGRIKDQHVLRGFLRNYGWKRRSDIPKILEKIDDVSILKELFREGDGSNPATGITNEIKAIAFGKLPEHDAEEIREALPVIDVGKALEFIDRMEYPKDRKILRDIMLGYCQSDTLAEAAAKKIPAEKEPYLVREVCMSGANGAVGVFVKYLKMPEDKDRLLQMLQRGKYKRRKAAEILAQDETMRDYRFCKYCGLPASQLKHEYMGLYNDMYYYGWKCRCGHTSSAPEGMGDPEDLSISVAEYLEQKDL